MKLAMFRFAVIMAVLALVASCSSSLPALSGARAPSAAVPLDPEPEPEPVVELPPEPPPETQLPVIVKPSPEPPPEPPPVSGKPAIPLDTVPHLRVTFSPRYFSPDGENDQLAIFLTAEDESKIAEWKIEIREPQAPYNLFYKWEGKGQPPEMLRWNGKSPKGELVQSASDYPFYFTATNTLGNTTAIQSIIEVDVFVIREGDILRIQIPSIVFTSNSGTWDGLDNDIVSENLWILRRIAQILNKFPDYHVGIEGHANPTVNPDDRAGRQREQVQELQPLSEERAKRILDELVYLGVNRNRLRAYGIGGAQPIAAWTDRDNWWKNRRVEFILVK